MEREREKYNGSIISIRKLQNEAVLHLKKALHKTHSACLSQAKVDRVEDEN